MTKPVGLIGKIFNDVEIKGWCKEQEAKNRVQDGVRLEEAVQTGSAA